MSVALAAPPAPPAAEAAPVREAPPARPAAPPIPAPPVAGGNRVTLAGVGWDAYVALREAPGNDHVRMTYDGPAGLLELEMPGQLHESVKCLLHALVTAFAEERRIALRATGATTQQRPDLLRGLEGDETYLISQFDRVRGRASDLSAGDPPPDLAVEVDVTSPSVSKLPIYAALGVPEVWSWRDGAITVRRLGGDGAYAVADGSRELPGFPLRLAERLLARWADAAQYELTGEFRAAVRADAVD